MLGLLYHHATLLALILIVTFSALIFTSAILKIMKMKKMNKTKQFLQKVLRELEKQLWQALEHAQLNRSDEETAEEVWLPIEAEEVVV